MAAAVEEAQEKKPLNLWFLFAIGCGTWRQMRSEACPRDLQTAAPGERCPRARDGIQYVSMWASLTIFKFFHMVCIQ